jgi:hypothetical protein
VLGAFRTVVAVAVASPAFALAGVTPASGGPSTDAQRRTIASLAVQDPARPRIVAQWAGDETTLSWSTGTSRTGSLYAARAGGVERLVGRAARDAVRVRWIVPGVRYTFRLYAGSRSR